MARSITSKPRRPVDATTPIAVIGLSGRYPSADNLDAFWKNLIDGRDCVDAISADHWSLDGFYPGDRESAAERVLSYTQWAGLMRCPPSAHGDGFPLGQQNRLALTCEMTLLAAVVADLLAIAHYDVEKIDHVCHRSVGIYLGVSSRPHLRRRCESHGVGIDDAVASSSAYSIGRVSRLFHLTGPCIAIDTQCASATTALHAACTALRAGDCEAAIAGGMALLHDEVFKHCHAIGMLAKHRESRSFSAGRSGTLLSEGAGVVMLKLLADAIRDGDDVWAIIRSTSVSFLDSSRLPGVASDESLLRAINANIRQSGVSARSIHYVEAAACGLRSDASEISVLSKAFREHTQAKSFCALGAVQSNLGHAIEATGASQLAKVVLQLRHKLLVPTIMAQPDSIDLPLPSSPFRLQHGLQEWPAPTVQRGKAQPRRAMINSLGAGGFYAGAVVEEYRAEAHT